MREPRQELRRLILDGLLGRSVEALWRAARARFEAAQETLSWQAFTSWVEGRSFPANRKRQELLADAVGGACGEAIRALRGLAFRGWRTRMMKEHEMGTERRSTSMKQLQFPVVNRPGGDGRPSWQAEITCASCGATYHHARGGTVGSEEYFRRKGWEVGKDVAKCFCPRCVENRRKVVKMSDHKKAAEPVVEAGRTMSREDGRLLSRAIEDHWDDAMKRYKPGWSDMKLADDQGVPIDWVRGIRERDFGGVGEDPGVARFIAEQIVIKSDMDALHKDMEDLASTVSSFSSTHMEAAQKMATLLASTREKQSKLSVRVHQLYEMAQSLRPFDKAG